MTRLLELIRDHRRRATDGASSDIGFGFRVGPDGPIPSLETAVKEALAMREETMASATALCRA
jgi:hypothetical protein